MKKIIIDSHCDTALKFLNGSNINDNNNQFTLKRALKYDKYIQFFAMYIEPEYVINGEYELFSRLINFFNIEIKKNDKCVYIIENKNQLLSYMNEKRNKLGIIISVEDAICLEGRIENLKKLYDYGIRVMGLTWNGKNQVATGVNYDGFDEDGLTEFGVEVVKKMNELGMIIDVSHLSEKSFYDVISITKRPIIASHSCSKTLCNHKRNLSDDQIKIISNNKGMIGVNFYNEFLSENKSDANIKLLVKHIKHISNIGGIDCVGLGSDYDGINRKSVVSGLENNSKLYKLPKYLRKEGFNEEEIDRIMWKNHFEFLKRELQ